MEAIKKVKLQLVRYFNDSQIILGNLYGYDSERKTYLYGLSLFTLENAVKAIPVGIYPYRLSVTPATSKWFGKQSYILTIDDVPGRSGIQIHVGNTIKDTTGCILVGLEENDNQDALLASQPAFNQLVKWLQDNSQQTGYIQVTNL